MFGLRLGQQQIHVQVHQQCAVACLTKPGSIWRDMKLSASMNILSSAQFASMHDSVFKMMASHSTI